MKMLRFLWIIALVLAIAPSLNVLAGSDSGTTDEFALGYFDPTEQVEYLSYPEEASSVALVESLTGDLETDVIRLINMERNAAGLLPVKANPALATIALAHSTVMRDQSCFSHQCTGEPTVPDRALAAGYGPYGWGAPFVGEIIAAGFVDAATMVQAWMDSTGHRDIILDGQLREVGAGFVAGGYYGTYWTVDFGSQPNVLPVFINFDDIETQSRQATLYLTNETVSDWGGIDFASNVMISNDPNFAGAQWEAYSTQKPWTLPTGNGAKTFYVKFRDDNGAVVTSSDDILLNEPIQNDLVVSTNFLSFIYELGEGFTTNPSRLVQVDNAAGDVPIRWTACSSDPWISLEATEGTTPGSVLLSVSDFRTDTIGTTQTEGTTPGSVLLSISDFRTDTIGTTQTTVTITSPDAPDSIEQVTVIIQAVEQVHRVFLPCIARNR